MSPSRRNEIVSRPVEIIILLVFVDAIFNTRVISQLQSDVNFVMSGTRAMRDSIRSFRYIPLALSTSAQRNDWNSQLQEVSGTRNQPTRPNNKVSGSATKLEAVRPPKKEEILF